MKLSVLLGQDLSAYAEIDLEVPDGLSKEGIISAIKAYTKSLDFEEAVFDEDWSSASSLRIVRAKNGDDYILEDVALEPVLYDGGQILQSWLKGYDTLKEVVDSAAELKLIDKPTKEAYRGTFKLPGATVHIEFECRRGATREEKDLAFLDALAQIGTVDYVAIGDLPACSTCEHDPGACKDAGVCAISRHEV